jgi:hypothetical protein
MALSLVPLDAPTLSPTFTPEPTATPEPTPIPTIETCLATCFGQNCDFWMGASGWSCSIMENTYGCNFAQDARA